MTRKQPSERALEVSDCLLARQDLPWWERLPADVRGTQLTNWVDLVAHLQAHGWEEGADRKGDTLNRKLLRVYSEPAHWGTAGLRRFPREADSVVSYDEWLKLWLELRKAPDRPLGRHELALLVSRALGWPLTPAPQRAAWQAPLAGVAILALAGLAWWRTQVEVPVPVGSDSDRVAVDAPQPSAPSVSPDGRRLAFLSQGAWRILMLGGEAPSERVSEGGLGFAQWRTGGTELLFTRRNGAATEIAALDLGTRAVQPVLALSGARRYDNEWDALWFGVHPDGQRICFADAPTGHEPLSIWEFDRRTGQRRRLTQSATRPGDTQCAYSPDGQRLAFVRYLTYDAATLNALDPSTLAVSPWLPETMNLSGVVWSGKGELLFAARRPCQSAAVWRARQGGPVERVARPEPGDSFAYPSRSRGQPAEEYFQSHRQGADLWHAPPRGAPRRLTSTAWINEQPAPSPDRRWLAFASSRLGHSQIWLTDAGAATKELLVTECPPSHADSARWSPDGWLAYSAGRLRRTGRGAVQDRFVFRRRVVAAGVAAPGEPLRITADVPSGETALEEGRASWAADGSTVFFRSNRDRGEQIWSAAIGSGELRQLTREGGYEAFPGPDGFVYYVHKRGPTELRRVPISGAGGEVTVLAQGVQEGWWAVSERGIFAIMEDGEVHSLRAFTLDGQPRRDLPPVALPAGSQIRKGIAVTAAGDLFWAAETPRVTELRRVRR